MSTTFQEDDVESARPFEKEYWKEYKPTNPGSQQHNEGKCKPCNKFNPARPEDSCKHSEQCEFCHAPHERPKHRGQRGRHALQRRQFLETKDSQPPWMVSLINNIYQVPHTAVDDLKVRLGRQPSGKQKDDMVLKALEQIRDIGERAQNQRPDNSRLRGARIDPKEAPSVTELEGRVKWLVGTLHLMVRKMNEAHEPQERIEEKTKRLLEECENLPCYVMGDRGGYPCPPPPPPPPSGGSPYNSRSQSASYGTQPPEQERSLKLDPALQWIMPRFEILQRRAEEDDEPQAQEVVEAIMDKLARLPQHALTEEKKAELVKKRTLFDLQDALEKEHQLLADALFNEQEEDE